MANNAEDMTRPPIPKDQLKPGIVVPGDIVDEHGRIMIRTGTRITEHTLDTLGTTMLFAGANWPMQSTSTPGQVVKQLAAQRGENFEEDDRRQHTRKKWAVDLEVVVIEKQGEMTQQRLIKVQTIDISLGGFAFHFNQFLHVGTCLAARFKALPHEPILTGQVRSCVSIGGVKHRIGIEFTKREILEDAA